MRLLRLFDKYFLILMLIQAFVLIFIDSRIFKTSNLGDEAKKSKLIGVGAIVISIMLYIITEYMA